MPSFLGTTLPCFYEGLLLSCLGWLEQNLIGWNYPQKPRMQSWQMSRFTLGVPETTSKKIKKVFHDGNPGGKFRGVFCASLGVGNLMGGVVDPTYWFVFHGPQLVSCADDDPFIPGICVSRFKVREGVPISNQAVIFLEDLDGTFLQKTGTFLLWFLKKAQESHVCPVRWFGKRWKEHQI